MTALEAFERIESALTDLRLKDVWGEPVIGIEAIGFVSKVVGDRWTANLNRFGAGEVTPSEYAETALSLIREAGSYQHTQSLENLFANLARQQKGALGVAS